MGKQMINQPFAIAISLTVRHNRNILKLINAARLIRNYTFGLYPIVVKNKHFTAFKVLVNHAFLFVGHQ